MKNRIVEKVQDRLIKISLHSIGRSVPMGMYEREIPEAVLKLRNERSEELQEN